MPKLHLKRTPEEEAERQWRKKQKKEAKRRRKYGLDLDNDEDLPRKKPRPNPKDLDDVQFNRKWDSEDEDFIGPQPESSSSKNSYDPYAHAYKQDYESIRAEQEDRRFREKLSTAFEDDERLDSVEARLNSFAHVPMHWGGSDGSHPSGTGSRINYEEDDFMRIDPMTLDEEEYVEWIRHGMYRKTHTHEFEEKERKKAERAARRAHEKALREETERLEKAAAEERRHRRHEREHRKWEHARQEYDNRWKKLLAPIPTGDTATPFGFDDVPWPIHLTSSQSHQQKSDKDKDRNSKSRVISVSLEDLTRDAISLFLFSTTSSSTSASSSSSNQEGSKWEKEKKDRRDKLRETFLRFHPDKFEGRFMPRVKEAERDKVRQALGIVVRALNDLMEQG